MTNTNPCDDNNPCTTLDVCATGTCLGTAINCDDGKICTADLCVGGVCQHNPNTAVCDDGNPCTVGDTCAAGVCTPGTTKSCEDGDPCTVDGCNSTGCFHSAKSCGANGACDAVTGQCDCVTGWGVCGGTTCDTNLAADPANCGGCGYSCGLGACDNSSCVLASNLGQISSIAVDSTTIYVASNGNNAIYGVPIAGGAVATLASSQSGPNSIAVDGTNVYWTNQFNGTVMRVPKGGGSATVFANGQTTPWAIALNSSYVFWVTFGPADANSNYPNGTVMRMTKTGNGPVSLATAQNKPFSVAADESSVYWVNGGTNTLTKTGVYSVPINGGTPSVLVDGSGNVWTTPTAIAVDATRVFWGQAGDAYSDAVVVQMPLDGSSWVGVSTGEELARLALDSTMVYWTNGNGHAVRKAPIGGKGSATTVATDVSYTRAIAVDANHVYWAGAGTGKVRRVHK